MWPLFLWMCQRISIWALLSNRIGFQSCFKCLWLSLKCYWMLKMTWKIKSLLPNVAFFLTNSFDLAFEYKTWHTKWLSFQLSGEFQFHEYIDKRTLICKNSLDKFNLLKINRYHSRILDQVWQDFQWFLKLSLLLVLKSSKNFVNFMCMLRKNTFWSILSNFAKCHSQSITVQTAATIIYNVGNIEIWYKIFRDTGISGCQACTYDLTDRSCK